MYNLFETLNRTQKTIDDNIELFYKNIEKIDIDLECLNNECMHNVKLYLHNNIIKDTKLKGNIIWNIGERLNFIEPLKYVHFMKYGGKESQTKLNKLLNSNENLCYKVYDSNITYTKDKYIKLEYIEKENIWYKSVNNNIINHIIDEIYILDDNNKIINNEILNMKIYYDNYEERICLYENSGIIGNIYEIKLPIITDIIDNNIEYYYDLQFEFSNEINIKEIIIKLKEYINKKNNYRVDNKICLYNDKFINEIEIDDNYKSIYIIIKNNNHIIDINNKVSNITINKDILPINIFIKDNICKIDNVNKTKIILESINNIECKLIIIGVKECDLIL